MANTIAQFTNQNDWPQAPYAFLGREALPIRILPHSGNLLPHAPGLVRSHRKATERGERPRYLRLCPRSEACGNLSGRAIRNGVKLACLAASARPEGQ